MADPSLKGWRAGWCATPVEHVANPPFLALACSAANFASSSPSDLACSFAHVLTSAGSTWNSCPKSDSLTSLLYVLLGPNPFADVLQMVVGLSRALTMWYGS